jgi:ATP-dependent DNA ligase
MLAELKDELPVGDHVYEPKLDGFRGVLFAREDASLWSRNKKDLGKRFPELLEIRKSLPSCVLDGEIVAIRDGKVDFEALQQRLVTSGRRVDFIPFDIIELEGEDLRSRPLIERRKLLETIGMDLVPQTDDADSARKWFEELDRGVEGVVAKKKAQPYIPGERGWIKVKAYRTIDLAVGGITPAFGLLLGAYGEDGRFHHVGTTSPLRRQLRQEIEPMLEGLQAESSFDGNRPEWNRWRSNRIEHWTPVRPSIVVEVSYNRMDSARIRHAARFVRWRTDKDARECRV